MLDECTYKYLYLRKKKISHYKKKNSVAQKFLQSWFVTSQNCRMEIKKKKIFISSRRKKEHVLSYVCFNFSRLIKSTFDP